MGHVFLGEVFVTAHGAPPDLPAKIGQAVATGRAINWRLHDVTVTLLDDQPR